MTNRIILIFVCMLSICFNTFVSTADECVEDLKSLVTKFNTSDNIQKIQKTFYPYKKKPAPHYVYINYCYDEPCNVSTAKYNYYWSDINIFDVLGYHQFIALTFDLEDIRYENPVQSFIIPQICNDTNLRELLGSLTLQVTLYYY